MVIYKITNLINGKQYIGRDSHNDPNYYGSGPAIKNAIKKYGKQNFKKEIIEECSSFENLVEREEYWLNYYDVGNNKLFYNMHNSGKGTGSGKNNPMFGKTGFWLNKNLSDETKRKMSEAARNRHIYGKKTPCMKKNIQKKQEQK